MAYIGQSIKNGTFTDLGFSGTFNSSTTAFNLGTQVGSPAQLLVSKNGVIQRPGTDYTLATGGTQISFTSAPASGDNIFIVEISGAVGGPMNRDLNGEELILDVDGDSSIHADTDDQIDFKVGGSDVVTIDSSGDLGIGDTSPDAPLHVHRAGSNGAVTEMVRLSTAAQNDGSGIKVDFRTAHTNGILELVDGSGSFDGEFKLKTGTGSALATPADRLTVTSTDITVNTGNIVFGTSGKGVHLGVTSATASNLLDDYEFGTWTPSLTNFSTSGTVTTVGRYVKAGRMVTAIGSMKAATSIAHDTSALVSGFPFAGPVTDFGTGSFAFASNNGGNDSGVLFCDLISSRVFFPSSMNSTTSNELCVFTVTYESAS